MKNETNYSKIQVGKVMVKDMYWLNRLDQIAALMFNHNLEKDFYKDSRMKSIDWLVENQDIIESHLQKHLKESLDKIKFDLILNTNLDERIDLIISINDIQEFSKYVSDGFAGHVTNESIEEKFKKFKKLDDYNKLIYFESIKLR